MTGETFAYWAVYTREGQPPPPCSWSAHRLDVLDERRAAEHSA